MWEKMSHIDREDTLKSEIGYCNLTSEHYYRCVYEQKKYWGEKVEVRL